MALACMYHPQGHRRCPCGPACPPSRCGDGASVAMRRVGSLRCLRHRQFTGDTPPRDRVLHVNQVSLCQPSAAPRLTAIGFLPVNLVFSLGKTLVTLEDVHALCGSGLENRSRVAFPLSTRDASAPMSPARNNTMLERFTGAQTIGDPPRLVHARRRAATLVTTLPNLHFVIFRRAGDWAETMQRLINHAVQTSLDTRERLMTGTGRPVIRQSGTPGARPSFLARPGHRPPIRARCSAAYKGSLASRRRRSPPLTPPPRRAVRAAFSDGRRRGVRRRARRVAPPGASRNRIGTLLTSGRPFHVVSLLPSR
jgi:hypothetical protein